MQASAESPPRNWKLWVVVVGVILLAGGFAGGYFATKLSTSPSATPGPVSGLARASVIPLEQGWYRNQSITYLNFGSDPNVTAPILAFYLSSSPSTPVAGQRNIIDTIPGQPGYSDFWSIYKVLVPSGYVANSVKSLAEAVAAGYPFEATATIVNCPVVNPNATLQGSSQGLVQGWYRDRAVYYFMEGTNTTGYGPVIRPAPIYTFVYSTGLPVPGQRNVIDVLPGQPGYSDLWQLVEVQVASSYTANSIQSVASIDAAVAGGQASLQITDGFVNCPVVS